MMVPISGPNFQAGESLSNGINVTGTLQAVAVPANWTPALLTFQLSPDSGATWFDLLTNDNVELAYNITPGTMFNVPPSSPLDNKTWLRFRSGSSRYPVVQTEASTFTLITVS